MLKLAKDFYITSTQNNDSWKQSKLDREFTYDFRYKEFLIYLKIAFEIIGYTKEDNIAIINFGYEVDIKRWLKENQDKKMVIIEIGAGNAIPTVRIQSKKIAFQVCS